MVTLIVVIVLALVFCIINGFHDSSTSSVSTMISTKVLKPKFAVLWAALFNFLAFLVFKLKIANMVSSGIVQVKTVTLGVLLSCLVAAIIWSLFTWKFSIPTSSSHALIGCFFGAAVAKGGFAALIGTAIFKIIVFIFLTPLISMIMSILISILLINLFRKFSSRIVEKRIRYLQLLSAAAYSLGQGSNDAQKVIGIIFLSLVVSGNFSTSDSIPFWVIISSYAALATGTLLGGLRLVKNIRQRITHQRPFEGFSAEIAGAITLYGISYLGIPVSSTHTITGSIIGAGITKRISAIRWGISLEIFWAWLLTIPLTAIFAAILYYCCSLFIIP